MKVYVDISKQCIIKTDDEDRTVFKGDENVDHIKVYFKEMPTQWYLTLGALLPNGRTIPQRLHDGNILTEEVDGTTYYYATFTLSKENGFTLMSGKTLFTLKIHHVNDSNVVIKEKTMGAIAVNVVDSTTEDENILILDGNTAEVVYNMKLAIENMQARLTNYENSFTSNQITARALLSILNDFSSYKVVFGHSYKEDEDDIESRKWYLMAVVNKNDNSDIIFGIDADGKVSVITDTFISKLDSINATIQNLEITDTASIETLEASDAQISSLQVHTLDVNDTAQILNLIVSTALLGKTDINGRLTAQKGVGIPKNYGLQNDETGEGLLFMPDGSMALNGTTKGLVLTLVKTISNLLCREYTFPDMNGNVLLKEQLPTLESDIIPDETLKRALGSVLKKWSHLFVETIKTDVVWVGDYPAITTKDRAELEEKIAGIEAGQNLADIVGTFALLSVYDTTNLKVNDKIQVLIDETKEDDSTVYKWNGTSFEFVGSYGSNAYTIPEANAKYLELDKKINQNKEEMQANFNELDDAVSEIEKELAVDVIIYAIEDEEGNITYSSNYDNEKLIDILINNTPKHIKYATSLTDTDFEVYYLGQSDNASYYFTTYDNQIHIRINTVERTISYSESISGINRTIDKRTPLITATISAYDETTGVYTCTMESNGVWTPIIIFNQFPYLSKLVIDTGVYFSDNTFNTFDYIGKGIYKDDIQGVIYGNSKYDIVLYGSQTLYIFNKRQELEDKIDDYHVEVIVSGSNTETGGVSYTFSHTMEELIDIFTNKTPKHIKVSGDYFGTDAYTTKAFTFSSTYVKKSRFYYYYTNLDEKVSILVSGNNVSVSIAKNDIGESIESLETTVGNINSILDTLNGEVL